MDHKQLGRRLSRQAQLAQEIMVLDGGFATFLTKNPVRGWRDIDAPWPGQIRAIPAVNAQGLSHWRHATAGELLRWAMYGCPGWERKAVPAVIAAGSAYQMSGTIVRLHDPSTGTVQLTTTQLSATQNNAGARLRALLQIEPDALALCVVPRG